MTKQEYLWVEKYRPRKIADCVLPQELRDAFQKFVDSGSVPNMLLSGSSGVGKTTVARAMLEELGADYIVINGSLRGNIDTLRVDIQAFASTVSFTSGRKYVILDEADYLNPNSTQPALRNFMEEYANNCGFVMTCNFKARIIQPLQSRCSVVDFVIPREQKAALASKFMKRAQQILEAEGVGEVDPKVLAALISKHFPDWRRSINELQRYSIHGKIDAGMLAQVKSEDLTDLVKLLRAKDFVGMRRWVGQNSTIDTTTIYRKLYDSASEFLKPQSVPSLVLIVADYQYKAAFVADQEVNLAACLTSIMADCEFE